MVSDQEPRYRLVDANGNVVGSLFAESDGTLKLQEGTSGKENEVSLGTDGTLSVEQYSVGSAKFVGEGDVLPITSFSQSAATTATTTSTTYVGEAEVFQSRVPFDNILPDGAELAALLTATAIPGSGETHDIRVQNVDDGTTLVENTGASGKFSTGFQNYSAFTVGSPRSVRVQHRTNPGSNASELSFPTVWFGLRF